MSGQFLNRTLENAGGADLRNDAWVTNATLCRPQGDNDEKAAAVCCAPRLYRELAVLPVSAPILALGKSAAASILNVKSILLARGFIWTAKTIDESAIQALKNKAAKTKNPVDKLKHAILRGRANLAGRKVFPTIHPAFVLRLDSWHPVLKVDVERFVRFYRGEIDASALDDVGPYRVLRTPERVERELAKLRRDVRSVDIETDGINPLTARILCVGVGDGYDGVVIRWQDDPDNDNILIPKLAKVLSKALSVAQAVPFHNGFNFDHIGLERDGVVLGDNVEDTLFALHSFASHLPKRLDWLASIYSDANPWKVKFGRRGAEEKGLAPHKMPKKELWLYNNSDCKLTARGWRACQDDLKVERHIYEHDKQLAQITKEMQVTGIPVDRRRKDELSLQLKRHASALKWKMRELTGRFTFKPSRLDDVRWAIFEKFGAPVFAITGTGLPSTSNGTIEALRSGDTEAGIFADLLLQWRAAMKVKGTYVDSLELDGDDRAHFNWRVFGTVSGRWSCRLQSCPRWSEKIEDRPRELYVAEPGSTLVYFDLSQSEMRGAAYLSGDKNFIATCESGDVHSGNAKILFPQAAEVLTNDPKGEGKRFRDIAKNGGFWHSLLRRNRDHLHVLACEGLRRAAQRRTSHVRPSAQHVRSLLRVLRGEPRVLQEERLAAHGHPRSQTSDRLFPEARRRLQFQGPILDRRFDEPASHRTETTAAARVLRRCADPRRAHYSLLGPLRGARQKVDSRNLGRTCFHPGERLLLPDASGFEGGRAMVRVWLDG
jgi:DNA polymerase I-like protein with 3'-5' exonuclease and polymerase domains/uracil-DNA glycosylase